MRHMCRILDSGDGLQVCVLAENQAIGFCLYYLRNRRRMNRTGRHGEDNRCVVVAAMKLQVRVQVRMLVGLGSKDRGLLRQVPIGLEVFRLLPDPETNSGPA